VSDLSWLILTIFQIISGQLQLHRIHPQNILLTGSSPVLQSNHVILNQPTTQPVVLDPPQTSQTSRQPSSQQDVIALVNPADSSRLQMVYSSGGNAVIYAPQPSNLKRNENTIMSSGDVVALQHTPVIQTAAISQDNGNGWGRGIWIR